MHTLALANLADITEDISFRKKKVPSITVKLALWSCTALYIFET